MACTAVTLNGIALDCGNVGGLKKLYITPYTSFNSASLVSDLVTGLALTGSLKFKEFSFRKGNANFVSTGNSDIQAGTNFVDTVVTCQFNKMENSKRTEMVSLVSSPALVIAQDNNDLYWLIGKDYYATSVVNGQTGAQMGEGNFYTLTMNAQTPSLPYEVTGSIISGLI